MTIITMLIRSTPCFSADITSHKSPVVIIAIVTLVASVHTKIVFIDHFICSYYSGYILIVGPLCSSCIIAWLVIILERATIRMIWCLVRKGQYRIHLVPRLFYTALSFSHFTTYKTSLYYFFQCDVSTSIEMSTASMPMVLSLDGFVKTTLSLIWVMLTTPSIL